jgi:DNA-binding beta-propeller fold protein YncE
MSKHIRVCSALAIMAVACMVTLALLVVVVKAMAAPSLWTGKGATGMRSSVPEGVDLDVTYISRAPLYQAYCVEYLYDAPNQPGRPMLCPGTENDRRWPEPGEIVTFTAHVVNKGTLASPAFGYAWHVDGVEVASGMLLALAPTEEVTTSLQWPWPHGLSPDGQRALGEHSVRFTADPTDAIAETYESNNSLQDRTDAMSFSIYITPEMYVAYNVPVTDSLPYSAEDWLQKQIAAMKGNFANSIYSATPQGSSLRVRINTIGVVSTDPGADGKHDGGWYLKDDVRYGASGWYDPASDVDWNLVHELSHQVSIIDLYAIGIVADSVFVTDQMGNPLNVACDWPNPGIMGGGDVSPHTEHHLYSSHSAGGSSTFAGYRNGYYGSYLFDIPLNNYLLILDSQGNPAPGVEVDLFQRTGPWDWTGHMGLDNIAEISGATGPDGVFPLPNRSANGGVVTANGHVMHDNPFGVVDIIGNQGLFLVRLTQDDHEEFHWLDITDFNPAYWLGNTVSHTLTLSSHVPSPGAPPAPSLTELRVEGDLATLCWSASPSPGVVGYRVYRATLPRFAYTLASELVDRLCFDETFSTSTYGGRVYAVTTVDGLGRESGFSNFGWVPSLTNPSSVVITGPGQRIILDPRNGYALARQDSDGQYRQYVGSVHYHLEYSQFMGLDASGHLLFSHPGDYYDPRHSVRLSNQQGRPLFEFGEQGSGPGQFETPAGVAAWGEACAYGGPYTVDEHTLLLLHFDGDYDGAEGEVGTADGASFVPGVFDQGVLIDATDTLTYSTAGNLNRTAGTIEFWARFEQEGAAGQIHDLFEFDSPGGGIQIVKHSGGNLHALMWSPTNLTDIHAETGDWQAGEWHQVAVTWQGSQMALLVDGFPQASSDTASPPDSLAETLYVGSSPRGDWQANAVIDELRISDIPRLGDGEVCSRILVADSGNHRLQAFDLLGNLLSAYGSQGSGEGQFRHPQGVAVDPSDRVLVVDQGNNRLVVLTFDGTEFGYLGSFGAGFNTPSGVAVDAWGHIVVADTGNNRVVVLDPQGNFLAEYTEPNDGYTGPFNAPRGVAVEPDGDLVVADTGNRRVITVHGALARYWRTWLPLVSRSWKAE